MGAGTCTPSYAENYENSDHGRQDALRMPYDVRRGRREQEIARRDQLRAEGREGEALGDDAGAALHPAYTDAGKKCTDAKQCKGGCVYPVKGGGKDPKHGTKVSGRCKADNDYGCFGWVKNGRLESITCVD